MNRLSFERASVVEAEKRGVPICPPDAFGEVHFKLLKRPYRAKVAPAGKAAPRASDVVLVCCFGPFDVKDDLVRIDES